MALIDDRRDYRAKTRANDVADPVMRSELTHPQRWPAQEAGPDLIEPPVTGPPINTLLTTDETDRKPWHCRRLHVGLWRQR